MRPDIKRVIEETSMQSAAGLIHFGEVVSRLMQAGIESYHVDYRTGRVTYYAENGDTLALDSKVSLSGQAPEFSAADIKSAIVAAQRGEIMYPEFQKRSSQAGCVAYTVWLAGRHVSYFGRKGETHIERFPD